MGTASPFPSRSKRTIKLDISKPKRDLKPAASRKGFNAKLEEALKLNLRREIARTGSVRGVEDALFTSAQVQAGAKTVFLHGKPLSETSRRDQIQVFKDSYQETQKPRIILEKIIDWLLTSPPVTSITVNEFQKSAYLPKVEIKGKAQSAFKTGVNTSALQASRLIIAQRLEEVKQNYPESYVLAELFSHSDEAAMADQGLVTSANKSKIAILKDEPVRSQLPSDQSFGEISFVTGLDESIIEFFDSVNTHN